MGSVATVEFGFLDLVTHCFTLTSMCRELVRLLRFTSVFSLKSPTLK